VRYLFHQKIPTSDEDFAMVGLVKMPKEFGASLVENDDGEPDVRFWFEVRDGAPRCVQVTVTATEGGHEVRCSGLAGIRVQDVLDRTIKVLIGGRPIVGDGTVDWQRLYPSEAEEHRAVREAQRARTVKISDDLLREVVRVYRANLEGAPTVAVAEHFGKKTRTARLYLQAARERTDPDTGQKFLGKPIKGKAGEQ
jgi:hypothetical protein